MFLLDKPSFKQLSENSELHSHLQSHVEKCTYFGQVLAV